MPPKRRETFKIVSVREERPSAWLVEIDGGTNSGRRVFLIARAYEAAGRDGGWWIRPTAGWENRSGLDRPTEDEEKKILAAIQAAKRSQVGERPPRERGDLFFPGDGDEPESNESDEEFFREALGQHADDFFRMPGVAFQRDSALGSEDSISRGALWELYALLVAFDAARVRVPKLASWDGERGAAAAFLDRAEPRVMEAIARMSERELSDALGHYNLERYRRTPTDAAHDFIDEHYSSRRSAR
jgi:hypothetical protein